MYLTRYKATGVALLGRLHIAQLDRAFVLKTKVSGSNPDMPIKKNAKTAPVLYERRLMPYKYALRSVGE